MRITEKYLQATCDRINRIMDTPLEPYARGEGNLVANIGCYHLDHAYGRVALYQMASECGGVRDILDGHMPKRDHYERMQAFIKGLENGK
jgi:hypothetical protein